MLTPYQLELIHGEIDGENTPERSVEVRELVETQPEALALMTSLRALDVLFREVPDRTPPPHLTQLIYNAMPPNSRASPRPGHAQGTTQTITRWAIQRWNVLTNLMGELMLTKKILIGATTAVAAIAIIGYALVDYPPSVFDAGTIGANDDMKGVQQAGRYKGRPMTEDDVTLSNPEIHALFQNDQVLRLVKSDAFREAMRNDAFRELQSSEAFRQLSASDAYRELQSSAAYRELQSSAAYRELQSSAAYRELQSSAAYRELQSSAAYRELQSSAAFRQLSANDANREVSANDAYREVMASDAYRAVMANDAFRAVMANDAFRAVMANDAFRAVMANDAFRTVMANDAYRQLQANDMFRALSRSQSLSEAFLNQAMRAQQ